MKILFDYWHPVGTIFLETYETILLKRKQFFFKYIRIEVFPVWYDKIAHHAKSG